MMGVSGDTGVKWDDLWNREYIIRRPRSKYTTSHLIILSQDMFHPLSLQMFVITRSVQDLVDQRISVDPGS